MIHLDGVLIVDKPHGVVSMRVVEQVKRLTQSKRAGHTGTLDPAATGVLPICLGRATKIASMLLGEDKEYHACLRLGLETDTYDLEGTVLRNATIPPSVTEELIRETLPEFTGVITQRPPAYSAVRVDGERLYDRARRGEIVEAPERQVTIHRIDLLSWDVPDLRLVVQCGKGTYIRSLAADLGRRLGPGGCLAELRRTRVGHLDLARAVTLDELDELVRGDRVAEALLSMADALAHLPAVTLNLSGRAKISHGQLLGLPDVLEDALPSLSCTCTCTSQTSQHPIRVLDADGQLMALAEPRGSGLQPRKVFAS